MLMKTLLDHLNKFATNLSATAQKPSGLYVSLEDELTQWEFRTLIANLWVSSEKTVTRESLAPIANWLKQRGLRIKNTDALPLHTPLSFANKLSMEVMRALHSVYKKEAIHFLFPDLEMALSVTGKRFIDSKLQQVVLTDDGKHGIEVYTCLNSLARHGGELRVTSEMEGARRVLTANEASRVIQHSKASLDYYNKIVTQDSKGARAAKLTMREELKQEFTVTASYGPQSELRLKDLVFTGAVSPFANRQALLDFMQNRIGQAQWESFLLGFNVQALTSLMLDGSTLTAVAQDVATYSADDRKNRAVLFALTLVYMKTRAQSGPYTGLWGGLTGYSMENRMDCVRVLLDFLGSDYPLTEMERFLTETNNTHLGASMAAGTIGYLLKGVRVAGAAMVDEPLEKRSPKLERASNGM
ncbi:MAG: hypothetical protein A3E85_05080 [Gammaproteobacteria bacterium RIFCSPHIGHO2_12_FULL_45_12]|nr:MAG: hypothetical protein A3E85_05080 [Gammaproteobacteria bacterium RIFCSPHIGHO2_12_FULL_45_12]